MKKRKLLLLLVLLMTAVSGAWAQEPATSGYCGDPNVHEGKDVTWSLTSGVLTISGTGAMANYGDTDEVPWNSDKSSITSAVIESGVTTIGDFAFSECANLASVSIPAGVTTIGENAFYESTNLTSITIPTSVTYIGYYVFYGCTKLATVTLNSNPFIGDSAFPDNATVTMNVPAHEGNTNEYWTTFYNQNYHFVADEKTKVFKVQLSGTELTIYEVEDKITQDMSGYVLKTIGGNPVMTLTKSTTSDDVWSHLEGVAVAGGETSDGTMFVLSNGSQGVGFYRLKSGNTLGVGKAYLRYSGALAREFFGFGEATGIVSIENGKWKIEDDNWYGLDGRKLDGKPTRKGLYIVNGKMVVIK